jgi:hypothetical protein
VNSHWSRVTSPDELSFAARLPEVCTAYESDGTAAMGYRYALYAAE